MKLQLVAFLLTAAVQDNDAEKLFRAMAAKLDKAKTVQITFEATAEKGGEREGTIKGTLLLGEDNKLRVDVRANFDKEDQRIILISDGKTLRMIERDGAPNDMEAPKNLKAAVIESIKRVGAATGLLILLEGNGRKGDIKVEELYKSSEFKLGKKDKVGDKEAQLLEFKIDINTGREVVPGSVVIWIDAKTQLPLKHVVTAEVPNQRRVVVTQIYTSLRLDEKIDAKLFEVPK